jgi:RNA polymerase sigma-70 factor (ECF subfamily)
VSATEPSPRAFPRSIDAEQLFQEYSGAVYRYCLRRLDSPEEAEDAVQVTFLNAWRGLRQGVQPEEPRAWLFTIAANVSSTMLRSRLRGGKVEVRAPEDFERLPSEERLGDEVVDLDAALMALPVRQRQALLLRCWRGLSYAEIALELASSKAAVATLLFRARDAVSDAVGTPSQRIRRAPIRSALPAFFPWPSALWAGKSSFVGGATAKALAVAVGAAAPLVAFGIVDRTVLKDETLHAQANGPADAPLPVVALPAAPASTQPSRTVRPHRTAAVAAGKPSKPNSAGPGPHESTLPDPPTADATTPVSDTGAPTQPPPTVATPSEPATDEPETDSGRVVICHVTGSKKHPVVTISVAPAAADAHLAHGDQLGPCAG